MVCGSCKALGGPGRSGRPGRVWEALWAVVTDAELSMLSRFLGCRGVPQARQPPGGCSSRGPRGVPAKFLGLGFIPLQLRGRAS